MEVFTHPFVALPPLLSANASFLEFILAHYIPVLDNVLAHLPTKSLFALYATSHSLRAILKAYPLAWRSLSFRLNQPLIHDSDARQNRPHPLDSSLKLFILPVATRLTNLDLCNTSVLGSLLMTHVIGQRAHTLKHLSVRGCKNVSLKYHIVPFLRLHKQDIQMYGYQQPLALKSLYVYRCRHHRRRPYLPASLFRRDSDSEPTHELIELCHALDIWTDTAWCPTPGPRCCRRKDYFNNRSAPGSTEVWVPFDRLWRSSNRIGPSSPSHLHHHHNHQHVSSSRPPSPSLISLSSSYSAQAPPPPPPRAGILWDEHEYGHDGEPLGIAGGYFGGEGRHVPAHLRQSHLQFVDNVRCHDCLQIIPERCETCSIKMHCMACRKTLCGSCAFNRPLPCPKPSAATAAADNDDDNDEQDQDEDATHPAVSLDRYWWAPGATKSPNLVIDLPDDDDPTGVAAFVAASNNLRNMQIPAPPPIAAHHIILPNHPPQVPFLTFSNDRPPLRLNFKWCCLEPLFSGGGGVAFVGPGLGGPPNDRVRAVPLPNIPQYLDPEFFPSRLNDSAFASDHELQFALDNLGISSPNFTSTYNSNTSSCHNGSSIDIMTYLQHYSIHNTSYTCPRSLCLSCYEMPQWKICCQACKRPICKEHDFRALKLRKCGYRDLADEREFIRNPPKNVTFIRKKPHWPRDLLIPGYQPHPNQHSHALQDSPMQSPLPYFVVDAAATAADDDAVRDRRPRPTSFEDNIQEESDAGSSIEGPSTRDPSSTPRLIPAGPSYDRSSSTTRMPATDFGPDDDDDDLALDVGIKPLPGFDNSDNTGGAGASAGASTGAAIASVSTADPSSSSTPAAAVLDAIAPLTPINPSAYLANRVRSASMSDLISVSPYAFNPTAYFGKGKSRITTQPISRDQLLLPCSPIHPVQWSGCGAYFCQAQRIMGDVRARCPAGGKDCQECGVYVCEACLEVEAQHRPADYLPCVCTYCTSHFHCPHCAAKPTVLMRCQRDRLPVERRHREHVRTVIRSREQTTVTTVSMAVAAAAATAAGLDVVVVASAGLQYDHQQLEEEEEEGQRDSSVDE